MDNIFSNYFNDLNQPINLNLLYIEKEWYKLSPPRMTQCKVNPKATGFGRHYPG